MASIRWKAATIARMRRTEIFVLLLMLFPLLCGNGRMREYETRHYMLHSDLDPEQIRIVTVRMDKLADEYARRLSDLGPVDQKKLAFFLYRDPEDYYATGAPRASAGRFTGTALLATAPDFGPRTWHIIQHEAFHQFVSGVVKSGLPAWLNEGLAEYFGEAVFTGDGYVTGAIPQWRLERIRARFNAGEFKPLAEFLSLHAGKWDEELSLVNYDQAWSLVQYLAHGADAKNQNRFGNYVAQVAKGKSPEKAWNVAFGPVGELEAGWRQFWLNLPDDPTIDVYTDATVAALTSFLARGYSQGQRFIDFDEFQRAALAEQIKCDPDDWLPPAMLIDALRTAERLVAAGASISLQIPPDQELPIIQCRLAEGTTLTGRFTINQGRVGSVTTQRDRK